MMHAPDRLGFRGVDQRTRRSFNRRAAGTAAALAVLGASSACAQDSQGTGSAAGAAAGRSSAGSLAPATVSFLTWVDSADKLEIWQRSVDPFSESHPGIKVDFNTGVRGGKNYSEKLVSLLASDTAPDVFAVRQDDFPSLAANKSLLVLDPLVKRDAKEVALDDFLPAHREGSQYQGTRYGLPFSGGWPVMYYNIDLFKKLGLKPPSATWTWNDFLAAGQQLSRQPDLLASSRHSWQLFVWSFGGEILTPDHKRAVLDSPAAIDGLQFLYDQIHTHHTMPTNEEIKAENETKRFLNGRLGLRFANRGIVAQLRNDTGFQWTATHVPKGTHAVVDTGVNNMALWPGTRVKDAAWELLKHLTGPAGLVPRMAGGDAVPPRKSVLSHPSYLDATYPNNPDSKAFNKLWAEQLRDTKLDPVIPKWPEIDSALAEELTPFYAGQRSATETARAMTRAANAILAG